MGRGNGTPPPPPPAPEAGARVRGCGRLVFLGDEPPELPADRPVERGLDAAGVGGRTGVGGRAGPLAVRPGLAADRPAGFLAAPSPARSGRTGSFPTRPRFSVLPNSPEDPVMAYLPCGPDGAPALGAAGRGFGAGVGDGLGAEALAAAAGLGVGLGRRYFATGSTSPGCFFFFGCLGFRCGAGSRRFSPNRRETGPSPTEDFRPPPLDGAQGSSS